MKRTVLAFLLLPVLALAQDVAKIDGPVTAKKLVGCWQDLNEMAAGWRNTYVFFANGKIDWHANQMDQQKRLTDRNGTWSLSPSGKLMIHFTEESVIVGGKLIPGFGGDGDSDIKGGKLVHRKLRKPIDQTLTLSRIATKNDHPSMAIGHQRYWKFNDDPKQYD